MSTIGAESACHRAQVPQGSPRTAQHAIAEWPHRLLGGALLSRLFTDPYSTGAERRGGVAGATRQNLEGGQDENGEQRGTAQEYAG